MKLSYRGVAYDATTRTGYFKCETTAKYRGITYTIQQFGHILPASKPDLKYRGVSYHPCLTATQVKSRDFP